MRKTRADSGKEREDYIFKSDLAIRLDINTKTIERSARRLNLPVRTKSKKGHLVRYFSISDTLAIQKELVESKLRRRPEIQPPPERATNIYGSYQKIMFGTKDKK